VKTIVSSRGQVVLPVELREQDGIREGDELEVKRIRCGEYRLVRLERDNEGVVEWLLSCPEKDWFEAVPSESTDEIGR
jgi:AbrB family looped-hinge helix DNA binding protein